ncbi:hypothetical protein AAG906_007920 [Vitis piasezkii]
MMTEPSYTTGPSSQPSFTEFPHTELPSQSLLDLITSNRYLSAWRSIWINSRLHSSISSRALIALRVVRQVSMRR